MPDRSLKTIGKALLAGGAALLSGCALTTGAIELEPFQAPGAAPISAAAPGLSARPLKRKIVIGRITDATAPPKTPAAVSNADADQPAPAPPEALPPTLGARISALLSARLTETNQFVVIERPELTTARTGSRALAGADSLIVGALIGLRDASERGPGPGGEAWRRSVRAKVDLGVIDMRLGRVYYVVSGVGTVHAMVGAEAEATLQEQALAGAVDAVLGKMSRKLEERPWRSALLTVEGDQGTIAAGAGQGLAPGDLLQLFSEGETLASAPSGVRVDMAPTRLAELEVVSTFGATPAEEGAVVRVISGETPIEIGPELFVAPPFSE